MQTSELRPYDDLESLAYTLLYLLIGDLYGAFLLVLQRSQPRMQ